MPAWLAFVLFALLFAAAGGWLSRRLLDSHIGWGRAMGTAFVVFVASVPVAWWSLRAADVVRDDGTLVVAGPVAAAFLLLTVGWVFALTVIAIVTLEFLWPSHRWRNPIAAVRDAFRRRDRARRYAQILAIASRHGLGAFQNRHGGTEELAHAIVAALNDAGVTFVKLGQVLSSREDVLPRELIDALSTLQMDSTPIPWDEARGAIEKELGRSVDEVFASIDETPMAAASVAQVHTATLLTGEDVVVKIQRPEARAQVTTDLDILERLAADAERRTDWARDYGASALVAEFARTLSAELDYRVEVANIELLRGAIAHTESMPLRIPAVYDELCTTRMIVQERIRGVPFGRLRGGEVPDEYAHAIVDGVVDAVYEQMAVRGVFHADLHAGNLILDEDGRVALIDFGAVGILERSMRRMLMPLMLGIASDDDVATTDVVLLLCGAGPDSVDQASLQRDIGVMLTRMRNVPADENVFRSLLDALRRHRIALPPQLLLVFRTLMSLEGSLRRMVPGYDMIGRALARAPHFARISVSASDLLISAQTRLALAVESIGRIPRRVENLTRGLENGTLSVRLRAFEDAGERTWIESLLGKITTTVIGVALLSIGIALVVASGGPMLTDDVPLYPFLGSIVGLGGLLLITRSLRSALRRRDPTR
ncbi:ABC1 kinase family protein [Microbacterium thalassium]|uniref:Ubiquinone biosynthesis protein n=1 Tax=Microbacterium thalassium TaxID=362649 RepID=A0A7X0KU47_9MICO|nr:AarF/UbiB family protein [Microbacterium thalassium]MBB6390782.1 ubiquinone biosynthesis protein [Microbacterium thalassium]GLK25890.1 ubiquinone biosynthesis protein UbiB [Microbacterium thalassium]